MDKPAIYKFIVDEEDAGDRIDRVLTALLEEVSRSNVQKLIEGENVLVNGATANDKNYRLRQGDMLEIRMSEPIKLSALPENIPLNIIYEDKDILIVDKPKGMVVHPAPGNPSGTLVNAILFHCEGRLSSINGVIRPGIVHRIDKDTSGLLVVAKTDIAHNGLAEQLANHTITRLYRAIIYNSPSKDEGTVDGPIGRDPKNRLRMAVTPNNSRTAVTHYRVLERLGQFSYIEARLETGRTHQIRVHMAYIGHPLLGDLVYGPKKPSLNIQGQVLHAKVLGFRHPISDEYMEFESPLPEEFERILGRLRQ